MAATAVPYCNSIGKDLIYKMCLLVEEFISSSIPGIHLHVCRSCRGQGVSCTARACCCCCRCVLAVCLQHPLGLQHMHRQGASKPGNHANRWTERQASKYRISTPRPVRLEARELAKAHDRHRHRKIGRTKASWYTHTGAFIADQYRKYEGSLCGWQPFTRWA